MATIPQKIEQATAAASAAAAPAATPIMSANHASVGRDLTQVTNLYVELPLKTDPPLTHITLLKNCLGDNIFKPLCGAFSL